MRHVPERLRWLVWSVAGAFTTICLAGLLTRTLPDVFTIQPSVQAERLSYPIEYWNALGLVAALAIVLCTHMTSSRREPAAARVLGAAALPVLAVTLLFTFSRGPLAVAVIGVVAYLAMARPRALKAGALAAGPATALALLAAYRADLLASKEPTTEAAAAQGHEVALAVAISVLIAAAVRGACLRNGDRVPRLNLRPEEKRRLIAGTAAAVVLVVGFVLAATDFADRLDGQVDRFARSDVRQTGDYRDRLTNPGINRLDHWKISLDAFGDAPLGGRGAGTYALLWDRERPTNADSEEGHSLYLEVLGELGLVGAVLLAAFLLALLTGVARRVRGPDRSLYAAVLTASLMWVLHAGIDWDWEVAAVTLWLPVLAGAAASSSVFVAAPAGEPAESRSARGGARARPRGPRPPARAALAAGIIALAGTPALVAASQARLLQSLDAYEKGDCDTAGARALDSIAVLGGRPEPYEVIGYCNARGGSTREAEDAMRAAVKRDPGNWEYRYGLALVRSAGGRDPRAAARDALRLNPNEPAARNLVARTRTTDPDRWRRAAEQLAPDLAKASQT
jgi:O-antigen ligase